MRFSTILFCCSLLLCSSTCKKVGTTQPAAVDSIRIVRSGGIGGFNDRYLITSRHVAQDTSRNFSGSYTFNYKLPHAKYDSIKRLLNSIPARMMNENEYTYGQMVDDGFAYDITAWKGKTTYHWSILMYEPDYVKPFMQQLNEAFNTLYTPRQ